MEKVERRIIGVDPGTRVAGYGVVDIDSRGRILAVAVGAWKLPEKDTLAQRLAALAIHFRRVASAYNPQVLCIELPFVAANVRSALTLGAARGVILAEAAHHGMEVSEMSATSAKKIITGNGYSAKEKVAGALGSLLQVEFGRLPFDATDALALAYAFAFTRSGQQNVTPAGGLSGWQRLLQSEGELDGSGRRRRGKKRGAGFETFFGKST